MNATVTQRTKFMELIDLEPSVQVTGFPKENVERKKDIFVGEALHITWYKWIF